MYLFNPGPHQELNEILETLVTGIRTILKDNFLGAYLGGSFAHGGWDAYSDVDFDVVIADDLHHHKVEELKVLHAQVFTIDHYYARHLEGAYFPQEVLGDLTRTSEPLWYLDNGSLNFERSTHDNTLVNRWVLRNQGVTLIGPSPSTWIPPIPDEMLKAEVWETMHDWGVEILKGDYALENRFRQIFTVLMYCRMLHTLHSGRVESKPAGAEWAKATLAPQWIDLIDDALSARPNQYEKCYQPSDPEKVARTFSFVRYVISKADLELI